MSPNKFHSYVPHLKSSDSIIRSQNVILAEADKNYFNSTSYDGIENDSMKCVHIQKSNNICLICLKNWKRIDENTQSTQGPILWN